MYMADDLPMQARLAWCATNYDEIRVILERKADPDSYAKGNPGLNLTPEVINKMAAIAQDALNSLDAAYDEAMQNMRAARVKADQEIHRINDIEYNFEPEGE